MGLPWQLSWQRICLQCRRPWFNSQVRKIPWRRAWQPTPVFLPGESPWTEERGRLESLGSQRVGQDWATKYNTAQTGMSTKLDVLSRTGFWTPSENSLLSMLYFLTSENGARAYWRHIILTTPMLKYLGLRCCKSCNSQMVQQKTTTTK